MPLDAVIFDMDGVLVDSEPLWHAAEIAAFGEVGVDLTVADCLRTTGLRIDEVAAYWHARRPWSGDPGAVAADIVARMAHLLRTRAPVKPGAVAAVRYFAARGPVGLASSSADVLIDAVLDRLALRDAFRVVRSAEHEPHGKPHPGVYLSTAAALGANPARCLAVEDSGNGIRAAHAAGMRVVAVPDQPVAADALALAEVVLGSLEELPRWARDHAGA